jgi:outer membrane protein assembly factor BamA
MSFGLRAEGQYIRPYGSNPSLPIFEKFFLGGEYSVRGFEIRSIGPRDPFTNVVTGGNKALTFNAEYYINLFGQVRLLGFFDAGQVRDVGQSFAWKEDVIALRRPPLPLLVDPFARFSLLTVPGSITPEVIGTTSAFKTSTGGELRFMMPMLNVPFRLIGAFNPQRRGVLDANAQPTPRFTFRFAVGTTF